MAGGNAARTLRDEGFDGPVTIIGDEPGVPFGRPPLSKTYLRGEEDLTGWLVKPAEWYPRNDVELVHGSVKRIDTDKRRVELDRLGTIEYSKLLLATGGRNRRPQFPGASLEGVFQLRTVADCDAIKQAARSDAHALVVGMGFIGSEVAASLRQLGVAVTAVLPGKFPLASVLGPEMGAAMAGIHSGAGVKLIVAVGIEPNTELARGMGVAVDNGIVVDVACRTNVPDVFAAGDVVNHPHPLFGRVRVEHYNNAEKQGTAAARSMLGSDAPYSYLYTFWSDQYEHKLEYAGHARRWDRFVIRGSLEERKLVGFYLDNGVLKAAVGLNRGGDPELDADGEMAMAARLVARQAKPDPSALADDTIDLARL